MFSHRGGTSQVRILHLAQTLTLTQMKYRINSNYDDGSFDVINDRGNIATVMNTNGCTSIIYFKNNLVDYDDVSHIQDVWSYLNEGGFKVYHYSKEISKRDAVIDALEWFEFPLPALTDIDNNLFKHIDL